MAIARNMVIAGDFKGLPIKLDKSNKGFTPTIYILQRDGMHFGIDTKGGYQLVHEDISKSTGDALIGGLAFGAIGAIIGGSVTQKAYTIAIQDNDRIDLNVSATDRLSSPRVNYRYLIEIDEEIYKVFLEDNFK